MGEVERPEGGESSDELDALRKELLEIDRQKSELSETDEARRAEGEEAETSGSELDKLRDEIVHRHLSEEESA
jgi:hypothetical protein